MSWSDPTHPRAGWGAGSGCPGTGSVASHGPGSIPQHAGPECPGGRAVAHRRRLPGCGRRALPRMIFDFVDGGADGELGLSANREALDAVRFMPRYLADVGNPDQSTTVFGAPVRTPSSSRRRGSPPLVHPDGEPAAPVRPPMPASSSASAPARAIDSRTHRRGRWSTLVPALPLEDATTSSRRSIDAGPAAGYEALIVTVDVPVGGRSERDLRNGMSLPVRVRPGTALDAAPAPVAVANPQRSRDHVREPGRGRHGDDAMLHR